MVGALGDWERFLHQRGVMPDLIQCALMHEQFEAIHPFLDGNGRVGRLLITLFLIERRRLSHPLLYLSAYLEAHRNDYYDYLQRVRTDGDWAGWLHFFLAGVEETSRAAVAQANSLLDLRALLSEFLRGQPRAAALLDKLFVNPYVTVPQAAKFLEVSDPTARQAVRLLQEIAVLDEVPGRTWRRLYVARPILQVLEEPPPSE